MKQVILMALVTMASITAKAEVRTGIVSFGGIMVKVSVDEAQGTFQIGESKFQSPVMKVNGSRIVQGSKKVGIMTWDETLTATLHLSGGDGGNIQGFQEYQCDDVRITIVRTKGDGTKTVVKNECAFLNPSSH